MASATDLPHLLRSPYALSLLPEIWDMVCKYLDPSTLKGLRHVNRVLLRSATPCLFENVVVTMKNTSLNSLSRLAAPSLGGDTNLAPYVKRLTLDMTTSFTMASSWEDTEYPITPDRPDPENSRRRCDFRISQLYSTEVCQALSFLDNLDSIHVTTAPRIPRDRDYSESTMTDWQPETVFLLAMRTLINVKTLVTELKITTGLETRLSIDMFSRSLDTYWSYAPTSAMTDTARRLCFKNDIGLAVRALHHLQTLELVLYDSRNGFYDAHMNVGWLAKLLKRITPRVKHLVFDFITPELYSFDHSTADICDLHNPGSDLAGSSGLPSSDLRLDKTYPSLESLRVKNILFCTDEIIDFVRRHANTLKSLDVAFWSCHDDLPNRSTIEQISTGLGHNLLRQITFSQEFNTLGRPCNYRQHFPKLRNLCRYWKVNASMLWDLYSQAGLTEEAALLALSYEVDAPSDAEDAGPKHVEDVRKAQEEHEQALKGKDWSEIAEIGRKREVDAIAARQEGESRVNET